MSNKVKCNRLNCVNNEAGECQLKDPKLVKREGIDAYVNCLDQKNRED